MNEIKIKDDYIKLDQALKLSNEVESGAFAKYVIKNGEVKVNGEVEYQRGKKIRIGDIFTFNNHDYKVIRNTEL